MPFGTTSYYKREVYSQTEMVSYAILQSGFIKQMNLGKLTNFGSLFVYVQAIHLFHICCIYFQKTKAWNMLHVYKI